MTGIWYRSSSMHKAIAQQWLLVAVIVLVVVSFGVSFYLNNRVTSCLNTTLAARQVALDADHRADVLRVAAQEKAEADQLAGIKLITEDRPREGLALFNKGVSEFNKTLVDYIAATNHNAAIRAQHPLGKC